MDPQTLLSLHEHIPSQVTGQHDLIPGTDEGIGTIDTAGVIVAMLALIGILIAIAMLDGSAVSSLPSSASRLMLGTR